MFQGPNRSKQGPVSDSVNLPDLGDVIFYLMWPLGQNGFDIHVLNIINNNALDFCIRSLSKAPLHGPLA